MKKITFICLLISFSSLAITVPLTQKDSVRFNFLTSKTCYGNSAAFDVNGRTFQIGVFDLTSKGNDSIKKYGFIGVYRLDNLSLLTGSQKKRENTFFARFDLQNFLALYNLKYLLLEGEQYEITDVNLNNITLNKLPEVKKELLKYDNYLDCLYDLHYFNEKYTDSTGLMVKYDQLFKPKMLNVIYYTMKYCIPCEKMKYDMAEVGNSVNIHLNIVMEEGGHHDEVFNNLNERLFYDRKLVKNNLGYPTVLLFDGEGIFIKTINYPNENIIKTIYSYASGIN